MNKAEEIFRVGSERSFVQLKHAGRVFFIGLLTVFLVGCGGANPPDNATSASSGAMPLSTAQFDGDYGRPQLGSRRTQAVERLKSFFPAGGLNRIEIASARSSNAMGLDKGSSSANTVDLYRFFNQLTGVHFYTVSETEKALVQRDLPHFTYEGVAYSVMGTPDIDTVPVYRLYNRATGTHLYTASEEEVGRIAR